MRQARQELELVGISPWKGLISGPGGEARALSEAEEGSFNLIFRRKIWQFGGELMGPQKGDGKLRWCYSACRPTAGRWETSWQSATLCITGAMTHSTFPTF